MKCCAKIVQKYEFYWSISSLHLTSYLATLKGWRCPQFQEECQRKLFAINPFTRLVYKYFCEYESFVDECISTIKETLISANLQETRPKLTPYNNISTERYNKSANLTRRKANGSQNLIDWYSIKTQIKVIDFSLDKLLEPCMQVVQYEVDEENLGNYQEVISIFIPFCETSWCGFSGDSISKYVISRWTCFTTRCRVNIVIILVVCSLLAISITAVNTIVILIITLNKKLRHDHSQSIYRLSLAFADLLVGIIVFPTCINNLTKWTMTRFEHSGSVQVTGFNSSSNIFTVVDIQGRAGDFKSVFSKTYVNFAGFFTLLSIFVSVYTLAVAGFDRLVAVFRPLRYRSDKAKIVAIKASIASWCAAVLFAILPVFIPSLQYGLILSFFITLVDQLALVIFAIAFAFPLLIVWIVNLAACCAIHRNSKFRQHLSNISQIQAHKIENRFFTTLAWMVGIFSFSTVPIFALIVLSLFLPTIHTNVPRNLDLNATKMYLDVELVAAILLLCNSYWNFFIYNGRNKGFRNAVKVMFKVLRKKKSTSCNFR